MTRVTASYPAGLTPKQGEALAFIATRIAAKGYSPSYREISAHLGGASMSTVHRLVKSLVERGHLRHLPNRARTLALVTWPAGVAPRPAGDDGHVDMQIDLPPELVAAARAHCEAHGIDLGDLVEIALVGHLGGLS